MSDIKLLNHATTRITKFERWTAERGINHLPRSKLNRAQLRTWLAKFNLQWLLERSPLQIAMGTAASPSGDDQERNKRAQKCQSSELECLFHAELDGKEAGMLPKAPND